MSRRRYQPHRSPLKSPPNRLTPSKSSILDGDSASLVVTFDGQNAQEDWYAVTLPQPVEIARVVFSHGKTFHDGGWFDSRAGKPKIQILRAPGGAWETVGELAEYPETTATDGSKLKPGQAFTQKLNSPVKATALRILGVPACGDHPQQAFSSCGELQAFGPPDGLAPPR